MMIIEEINKLLEPFIVDLKDFKKLGDTPFRQHAFNGVYAPAKTGKTHFVLQQLNELNTEEYTTIWLDGDRNAELKDKFPNIYHKPVTPASNALQVLIDSKSSYDNCIFILDSYKDFSFGLDTDTNKGSQILFEGYQGLLDKGATLVIIFHTTKLYSEGKQQSFKLKGNADTIESKMDFLYELERTKDNIVNLKVVCSREAELFPGDKLTFGNKNLIADRIKEVVAGQPEISLRDLKKQEGLTQYTEMIDELEGSVYRIETKKAKGGGRPKKMVVLI